MEQIEIVYFLITMAAGIVMLGFQIFLLAHTGENKLKPLLYFYSAFTLIVLLNFTTSYLRANIYDYESIYYYLLLYLENPVMLCFLVFAIPYLVHSILELTEGKRRNLFFAVTAVGIFVLHNAAIFVNSASLQQTGADLTRYTALIKNSAFIIILIYCFIILFSGINNFDGRKKKFIRNLAILFGLIIPAAINDSIFLNETGIKLFPLFYSAAGIIFTRYYFRKYFSKSPAGSISLNIEGIEKELIEKYSLSSREIEVITLLLEGKSYREISEELFISLNTVKTHIRNIYPKLNVSSRHEIIKLAADLQIEQKSR